MRKIKKIIPLCFVLTFSAAGFAHAASPEFARTEEEWVKLRDNTLEYNEIAGLIEEYNPAVQKDLLDLDDFIKKYGRTNEKIAKKYRDLTDELEESISYPDIKDPSYATIMMSIISNESQIETLRNNADSLLEDSKIKHITIEKAKASLIKKAQENRISIDLLKKDHEIAELSLKQLENQLYSTKVKELAGMAINTDIAKIENNIENSKNNLITIKNNENKIRKELLIMTGWRQDASANITDLPFLNINEIRQLSIYDDSIKAIENNYDLKILKRKLENANETKTIGNLENEIKTQKETILTNINTSFNELQTKIMSYEYLQNQLNTQKQNHSLNEKRYNLGLCSLNELRNSEITLKNAELTLDKTKIELFQIYENYKMMINGLI